MGDGRLADDSERSRNARKREGKTRGERSRTAAVNKIENEYECE
jgi:hypothetical protein